MFRNKIVNDGELALKEFQTFRPDLILLDLMLPGIDGYQVCREIRHTSDVPIIMLSAKEKPLTRYLAWSLAPTTTLSSLLIQRTGCPCPCGSTPFPAQTGCSCQSDEKCALIRILLSTLTNYSVTYMGKQVDMPPKELELLYFLASSPNQVFTREQLLDHIWGYEYIGDTRTVDVHIKRLREKIKDHPNWSISTVWGIGYKFEVKSE